MPLEPVGLTNAIDDAFAVEWAIRMTPTPLPAAGKEDRLLLFAAVARGLLQYLAAHQAEFLTRVTLKRSSGDPTSYEVTDTGLNVSGG